MICDWWNHYKETPPIAGMMIEDGTFILEIDKIPALSLTVFLTQSKEIAYLEGFIKNPHFENISLHEVSQSLWDHCFLYAKNKGYKRLLAYCNNDKLKKKYQQFGMVNVLEPLSGFVKEL